jgi:hypothetical protein
MIMRMDPTTLRAGDADRERVAECLRIALREGRLDLTEYDERVGRAYAARTYAELDLLVADLPGAVPASLVTFADPAHPLPGAGGSTRGAVLAWTRVQWEGWLVAAALLCVLWGVTSGGTAGFFWPGFVLVPWGGRLLVRTVQGVRRDEPRRWAAGKAVKAAKKARKAAKRANRP